MKKWKDYTLLVILLAIAGTGLWEVMSTPNESVASATERTGEPVVTVVDRTRGWTDIDPILAGWSKSKLLDLQKASECPDAGYCVVLQRPEWPEDADWMGWWSPVSNNVSEIDLNAADKRNEVASARSWIVCHELSHALMGSLDQVPDREAPACVVDDPDGPPVPTDRDLAILRAAHGSGTAQEGTALAYIN